MKEDSIVTTHSPDPDDDFIFALAINNNAKAIVCGEKILVHWSASPINIITKTEFENLY
jgi:predicted nucleic acid-binding protein